MSLPQKVEVLDGGIRIATVGQHYGVNESTICFCSKNEDKIKGSVKPVVRRLRQPLGALCVWLEDEAQKGPAISGAVVTEVMRLYSQYTDSGVNNCIQNF